MKIKNLLLLCTIGFLVLHSISFTQTKEIIGYFPSWKWNYSDALMTYEKVPFSKITMLNYAFWYPLPNGTIIGRDSKGDSLALFPGNKKPSLIELAHQNNVRVLLSLGGWEDSGNFSAVASSDSTRKAFAHACAEIIRTIGFDGIDIDWEFPGLAEHKGTSEDKKNYTLLMQTLKDSLQLLEVSLKKKLLLTAAFPAQENLLKNFEFNTLISLLDLFNIMTYDFYGSWSPVSGHNSALYASSAQDTVNTIDATVRYYSEQLHVPPQKITIGIPFYGHTFAQCSALFTKHGGEDTLFFSKRGAFYYNIVNVLTKQNRTWDKNAQVPYIVLPEKNIVISYDDQQSVAAKANYVLQHNLRGAIIWEITGDYLNDGTTPLLDALYNTFSTRRALK